MVQGLIFVFRLTMPSDSKNKKPSENKYKSSDRQLNVNERTCANFNGDLKKANKSRNTDEENKVEEENDEVNLKCARSRESDSGSDSSSEDSQDETNEDEGDGSDDERIDDENDENTTATSKRCGGTLQSPIKCLNKICNSGRNNANNNEDYIVENGDHYTKVSNKEHKLSNYGNKKNVLHKNFANINPVKVKKYEGKIKSKMNTKFLQKLKKQKKKHKKRKKKSKRHSKKISREIVKAKLCRTCLKSLMKSLTKHKRKRYASTSSLSSSSSYTSSSSESSSESSSSLSSSFRKKFTNKKYKSSLHSKQNFKSDKAYDKYSQNTKNNQLNKGMELMYHASDEHAAYSMLDFTLPVDTNTFEENNSILSLSHSPSNHMDFTNTNYCGKELDCSEVLKDGVVCDVNEHGSSQNEPLSSCLPRNIDLNNDSQTISAIEYLNNFCAAKKDIETNDSMLAKQKSSHEKNHSKGSPTLECSDTFVGFHAEPNAFSQQQSLCDDLLMNSIYLGRCDAADDSAKSADLLSNVNDIQNTENNVDIIEMNYQVQTTNKMANVEQHLTKGNDCGKDVSSVDVVEKDEDSISRIINSDFSNNDNLKDWTYEYFETPNDHFAKYIFSPESELNENNVKGSPLPSCLATTGTKQKENLDVIKPVSSSSSQSSQSIQTTSDSTLGINASASLQTNVVSSLPSDELIPKNLIKISFNRPVSKFKELNPLTKNLDDAPENIGLKSSSKPPDNILNEQPRKHNSNKLNVLEKLSETTSKEQNCKKELTDKLATEHENNNKLYASVKPINIVKTSPASTLSLAESTKTKSNAKHASGNEKPSTSDCKSYNSKKVSSEQKSSSDRSRSLEKSRRRRSTSRSRDRYHHRVDKRYKDASKPSNQYLKRINKNYDDDDSSDDDSRREKKLKYKKGDISRYSKRNYDDSRYDKGYYSTSRKKEEKFENSKKYDKSERSTSPKKSSTSSHCVQMASSSPPPSSLSRVQYNHHEHHKYKYDKQPMRPYPHYRHYPPSVRMPPYLMPPTSFPPFMPPILPPHPAAPWSSVADYHQRPPPHQMFLQPGSQPAQIYYEYQIQTAVNDENDTALNINSSIGQTTNDDGKENMNVDECKEVEKK
ncbi:hypothetical protein HELRODRAFT_187919 [Helobdella robusta]|uniref:Uncharacterized protein n=1 Tax=Helobdella robusta TaxID=6412 RepID=T1FPH0_HELRO|nr:hypothetical protein HELRODRAFT_187919 [Helobdella robusta]ESO12593.1 hypothetical protein HELRODRAFT_187919 [Helobdella robusta]